MEINDTLARLREATAEINRATDDVRMKTTLERTWLLQDRLVFPNRVRYWRNLYEVVGNELTFLAET